MELTFRKVYKCFFLHSREILNAQLLMCPPITCLTLFLNFGVNVAEPELPGTDFFLAGVGTFLILTYKTFIKSYRSHRNYILSSGLNRTNDDRGKKKGSTLTGSGSLKFEF